MVNKLKITDNAITYVLKNKRDSVRKSKNSKDHEVAKSKGVIDMALAIRELNLIAKHFAKRPGYAVISVVIEKKNRIIAVLSSDNIQNEILLKDGESRAKWFIKLAEELDIRSFKFEKAV